MNKGGFYLKNRCLIKEIKKAFLISGFIENLSFISRIVQDVSEGIDEIITDFNKKKGGTTQCKRDFKYKK